MYFEKGSPSIGIFPKHAHTITSHYFAAKIGTYSNLHPMNTLVTSEIGLHGYFKYTGLTKSYANITVLTEILHEFLFFICNSDLIYAIP